MLHCMVLFDSFARCDDLICFIVVVGRLCFVWLKFICLIHVVRCVWWNCWVCLFGLFGLQAFDLVCVVLFFRWVTGLFYWYVFVVCDFVGLWFVGIWCCEFGLRFYRLFMCGIVWVIYAASLFGWFWMVLLVGLLGLFGCWVCLLCLCDWGGLLCCWCTVCVVYFRLVICFLWWVF